MSLLTTASLVVTPNAGEEGTLFSIVPDTGLGDMSVTRATTATRVNSAGLVELVPYNLLSYSQDFSNAYWFGEPGNTITSNTTTAPDGTLTADTFTATAGNEINVHNFNGFNLADGTFTYSVYLKNNGTNLIEAYLFKVGVGFAARGEINFSAGTFTASIGTGSIENVGNGWFRVSLTNTYTAGTFTTGTFTTSTTGTRSVFAWGAQLVEGSVAKDYQKTETRLNIPRLDYSNGTCPSLLVEPQRTNTFTWSEKLLVGYAFAYTSGTFTVTENTTDTLDPFGNNNADKFITAPSSINHNDSYNNSNASGNMTLSIFAKKGIGNAINLYEYNVLSGIGFSTTFDIENGTIISTGGSLVSNSIEDYGNGWYRCSITGPDTSAAGNIHRVTTFEGQTYLFGWQLELNSNYPTSYIPTTSASVTRNADVISKTGISSLIGQTEGTFFLDMYYDGVSNNFVLMQTFQNASQFNVIQLYLNSFKRLAFEVGNDGAILSPNSLVAGRYKMAGAYKNNDFVLYLNGDLIGTDTSGAVIATDAITFNDYFALPSTYKQVMEINSAALWKTRLTNTQLAALTSL